MWGRLRDRQDMLRLLAAVAAVNVQGHLEDYEPPSVRLAQILEEDEEDSRPLPGDGVTRQMEVMAFVAETGE